MNTRHITENLANMHLIDIINSLDKLSNRDIEKIICAGEITLRERQNEV